MGLIKDHAMYFLNTLVQSHHCIIFISYFQTLNMLKKSSSGTKRKDSALINKANKDQKSKRQKMTEVGPKPVKPETVKIVKKKSRFLKW